MSPAPPRHTSTTPATGRLAMRSAVTTAAKAMRRHSARAVDYYQQDSAHHLARVAEPGPNWSVELFDGDVLLDSNQISASQWVEQYHKQYTVKKDETVIVARFPTGDWVITDVLSDTAPVLWS